MHSLFAAASNATANEAIARKAGKAIALGVGFVVSALLSYGLSRQLGLVNTPSNHA